MKILITGGDGFIGRKISFYLHKLGYKVTRIIRKESNKIVDGINDIKLDINDKDWLKKIQISPNCVIHLVQSRNYKLFPEQALDIFQVNTKSTLELINWCHKNKVNKFLYTSTGSIYKDSENKINEESDIEINDMYSASKYSSELFLNAYSEFIDIRICRLFSVYGEGQKIGLIPTLINKIKNGQEIILNDNIGFETNPLYVDDCCKILSRILFLDNAPRILNIGGNQKFNVREMAEIISEVLKKKPIFKILNKKARKLNCDNILLNSIIPVENYIKFKDGIIKCIN